MHIYHISIDGTYYDVAGTEAAMAAYNKAAEFGDCLGLAVALVDEETGEVLADNWD